MKKTDFLFLAFTFLFPFISLAQTTGSFVFNVTFPQADYNVTRSLYFFVPEDYDDAQSYPLLVGFRGGPNTNAGQFRDQLQPLSDSLGAIILCPENEAHFWNEEGQTKLLFQYSLDTAMAMYNIDEDFIYLTGLSYGGRHAVIVAMDTDDGAIPNLRGVIPFAAGAEADQQPNYEDVAEIAPACICIGLNDSNTFIDVANNLHNDLTANGAASFLNEIPGVGHTVVFPTFPAEMMECFNFIEGQYEVSAGEEVFFEETIRVFPNPTNRILNLEFLGNPNETEALWLTDSAGRILKEIPVGETQVDISSFAKMGIVFLSMRKGGEVVSQKIIVK